jgi:hypothetical protein
MAALTGRTPSKYIRFILGDTADTLREIPVRSIGPVGLIHPEVDLSAIQDAVDGFLSGRPGFEMEFGGPFDSTAAAAVAASAAAPVLSGSHTVLNPLNGLQVPRSWGIYIGVRAYWETGAPVFGISKSATSGVLVTKYQVVPGDNDVMYTARLRLFPGSAVPAWGTAAVT